MPEKYRKKTEIVEVLKTYLGQPMEELKRFLQDRLHVLSGPGVVLFRDVIEGDFTVVPGDYILKSECGKISTCSPVEFDSEYEPIVDSTEIHRVVMNYGFTIKQAETMLSNSETRAILMANMQLNERQHVPTINISIEEARADVDIEKIAERLSGILSEECIQKHVY